MEDGIQGDERLMERIGCQREREVKGKEVRDAREGKKEEVRGCMFQPYAEFILAVSLGTYAGSPILFSADCSGNVSQIR